MSAQQLSDKYADRLNGVTDYAKLGEQFFDRQQVAI